ncbi:hypothetical protein [Flammeovirga sp. EKP202]|uniref:hypothetical protein n=1 Tax=Flammeovirga sp. EKP202 TaxID=2770592 RepID=UPI00165FDEC4|nr:hypothetical protein [Flammeovirga sp. EKP202]MBD0403616.1 hypothetical protein [Flammeovirga sp. EKP202]
MRFTFFIMGLLFVSLFSTAQTPIYTLEELSFLTEREKQAFENYINDSTQFLPLLVEMGENSNPELYAKVDKKLQSLYAYLEGLKVASKKPKKQIQIIYNEVHKAFFKKYVEVIPFYKIFTDGEYNCATATAIYAMVLDHFEIPYQIKEKPNHVYLIAYPEQESIVMESTTPSDTKLITMNMKMKSNIIDALIKDKLVTESEVKLKGVNEVFNEYFFNDKNINFKELISWLYANEGYAYIIDEYFKDALEQMKKADYIKSNEIFKEVIVSLNAQLLVTSKPFSIEYAEGVVKLVRFKGYNKELEDNNFSLEHLSFINELLVNNNDLETYKDTYEIFATIEDSVILHTIQYNHYDALARYYYDNEDFGNAVRKGMKAHELKPKNNEIMKLVTVSMLNHCQKKYRVDVSGRINYLTKKMELYPVLKENTKLQTVLVASYLENAHSMILNNEIPEAEANLKEFEWKYNPEEHYQIDQRSVEALYEQFGMYYFKRNQITKARKAFQKGLSYFPNSYILKTRLSYL